MLSRRHLFGLLGGAAVAPLLPAAAPNPLRADLADAIYSLTLSAEEPMVGALKIGDVLSFGWDERSYTGTQIAGGGVQCLTTEPTHGA